MDALHRLDSPSPWADAPVPTIPVRRTAGLDWPGEGRVAQVPAVLVLAMTARCCCDACVDTFVSRRRKAHLQAL